MWGLIIADSNNEKTEKPTENAKEVVEEEEDISNIDPRKLDIDKTCF